MSRAATAGRRRGARGSDFRAGSGGGERAWFLIGGIVRGGSSRLGGSAAATAAAAGALLLLYDRCGGGDVGGPGLNAGGGGVDGRHGDGSDSEAGGSGDLGRVGLDAGGGGGDIGGPGLYAGLSVFGSRIRPLTEPFLSLRSLFFVIKNQPFQDTTSLERPLGVCQLVTPPRPLLLVRLRPRPTHSLLGP